MTTTATAPLISLPQLQKEHFQAGDEKTLYDVVKQLVFVAIQKQS